MQATGVYLHTIPTIPAFDVCNIFKFQREMDQRKSHTAGEKFKKMIYTCCANMGSGSDKKKKKIRDLCANGYHT